MRTFDEGVSAAHFHATNHPEPRQRTMAECALAEYQRILSECVESGGRPSVVIMAMDCLMGRRTETAAAEIVDVNQSTINRVKYSVRLELCIGSESSTG